MKPKTILLDHGGGGKASHRLTEELLLPAFRNPVLERLGDGAVIDPPPGRLAFSTDTFVVDPIFFPGGDIGDLAVNGTVNDLAMCGARPLGLSVALVLEEGFPVADLEKVLDSMKRAAGTAGVPVLTGDTKVVPRGAADKIFINTSGIGTVPEEVQLGPERVRLGDRVILSGTMGDHGMAVLSVREGIAFSSEIRSDTAALNGLVERILEHGAGVRMLRDPTRGGVGTVLNEVALQAGVGILVREADLPVVPAVRGACDLLGTDPLYVANEGKLVAFVAPEDADRVLEALRLQEHGRDAALVGEVLAEHKGRVFMQTRIGGTRIVDMLTGVQLPRIC